MEQELLRKNQESQNRKPAQMSDQQSSLGGGLLQAI